MKPWKQKCPRVREEAKVLGALRNVWKEISLSGRAKMSMSERKESEILDFEEP